jgi:methanogenic corrinoid protein MtbC1
MLIRVGLMWASNGISSAQEHFVTNIIKQKLFASIDALPPANIPSRRWLLFLPENEFHEIGLLFSNYLIRHSGCHVVYLGSNVPFEALENSVKEIAPSDILFFLVQNNVPEEPQHYINALRKTFRNAEIHLSGNEKLIGQLKLGKGVSWIRSVEELKKKLV